ncbi:MAG: permease-like cell division protein FtsX [Spirillospora sp.]
MNEPEDRLTDALKNVGDTVRPGDVPPPPFPNRPPPRAARRPLVMGALIAAFVVVIGGMAAGGYVAFDRTLGDGGPSAASAEREVAVFLCVKGSSARACDHQDATETQRQAIKRRLETMPKVQRVTYETKQQAYERFKKEFSDDKDLVESAREGDIPDSFRVLVANVADARAVQKELMGHPGVDTVVIDPGGPRA